MSGPYDDIINLPHHVSATRQRMPHENRAAQFAPFAALTGYDAAIKETARITDERIELSESAMAELNLKLGFLSDNISSHPEIAITFFRPDEKKAGGAYITTVGRVKRIDDYECVLILMGGNRISIEDILDIDGEILNAIT